MTDGGQRLLSSALLVLATAFAGCAPERDVVATERAQTATGGGAGAGVTAAAGGSAGAAGSAASGGAGGPSTACTKLMADPAAALALFDFEDASGASQVLDLLEQRPASINGGIGSVVAGPDGCGNALAFGNSERYLLLADDPVWTLPQGSIDAWFWVPATIDAALGILSRDQFGSQVGHFSVFLLPDHTVLARLQQSGLNVAPEQLAMGCSTEALPSGAWAHFGFNFGPDGTSLYVNGKLATGTGTPGLALGDVMCGAKLASAQIPDLPLPWVLGASIYASQDVPNARELPFLNGAIDNFRISNVERDFASAF